MKSEREKNIQNIKDWARVYYYPLYRTAILGEKPYLYIIVTRVNYLTACLWLEHRNKKVNDGQKSFVKLPNKPNWLVMVRNFRRMQDKKMKVLDYLKERKNRNIPKQIK